MEPGKQSSALYRFGAFEADTRLGVLTKQGKRLPLQDLPFRALVMLLERPGELVTREEMQQQLWPRTVTDFNHGLNKAVNKIRDVLGDSAASPRFVETVARRGYRFLADVTVATPASGSAPGAGAEPTAGALAAGGAPMASDPPTAMHATPVVVDTPTLVSTTPVAVDTPTAVHTTPVAVDTPTAVHATPAVVDGPTALYAAPAVVDSPATPDIPPGVEGPALRRRHWKWAIALAAVLLLGVTLATLEKPKPAPVRSLAVLPLENLSGDASQDYFADGMTDELITQLARISALRVISRTSAMSYKNAHKSLTDIARELGVQAVVEGSVVSVGPKVRITAQLIRVPADEHIWGNSYEGDLRDTLKLQSEVAREIATNVRVTLSPHEQQALRETKQVNPESYEAYLKGRYFWSKRTAADLKSAIDYFNTAIAADPNYAEAYAGLADSYALAGDWEYGLMAPQDAWPKAIAAAKHALQLDENLGAAHASLAFAKDLFEWDWHGAETEFQRAIALSPNYATAHHWYAFHLLVMGRHRDAIDELHKAESLDPLSLIIGADISAALCISHLYDQAIAQSNKIVALDPNFSLAQYELGQALAQKHQHAEAITHFQRAIELGGHNAVFDSNLAYAYAESGQTHEALQILKDLEARSDQQPTAFPNIALAYAGLGEVDTAFMWLEKAYAARVNPSILLRPAFDPLRSDARFKSLLRRMNLPSP